MIRITEKSITVQGEPDKIYLSVMNPQHPTFRLHTQSTCVVLSSSFYEHCNFKQLIPNSFVFELKYREYCAIVELWAMGIRFNDYKDFLFDNDISIKLINGYDAWIGKELPGLHFAIKNRSL